jgi:hypothetical protein
MNFKSATFLPTDEGPPDHDCEEAMDEVHSSRLDLTHATLLDLELELFTDEAALSRVDSERLGSQSALVMTSYRLKPYHKDGLHNELNFGHWSWHYDVQRESR